jgi:hypothetical protein
MFSIFRQFFLWDISYGDKAMLKYFVRGRIGWWILHIVVVPFFFWLGHFVRF